MLSFGQQLVNNFIEIKLTKYKTFYGEINQLISSVKKPNKLSIKLTCKKIISRNTKKRMTKSLIRINLKERLNDKQ